MLKTRILTALAIGSLALSPAAARDTRSAQSVPPADQSKGSEVSRERLALIMETPADTCDAPGNGNKFGHVFGRGQGHQKGRGKGHACDGQSPG